ncbi:unnamed protein product [Blepharisma stoltei]|uniref:Uncharacterized protein n=1 Tax=Blepharisma stoltei TaxID=1481888 RepID=A0AAU9J6K6_9CILI|nr:unnamed protein product [Blepharisma stoltei]
MGNICSNSPIPKPLKIKNPLLMQRLYEIKIKPRTWTISLKIAKEESIEILPTTENLSDEFTQLKEQHNDEKIHYNDYYNKSAKLSMKLFEIEEEKRKTKEDIDELKSKIEQINKNIRNNSCENKENEIGNLLDNIDRDSRQKQLLEEELNCACEYYWPLALEYENLSKVLNGGESIINYYQYVLGSLKAHLEELEKNNAILKKELDIAANYLTK